MLSIQGGNPSGDPSAGRLLVKMNKPAPEEQLKFLSNIQRILDEGAFVSTYKYALLLGIADICVEHGTDYGNALRISTTLLAEKFVQYYSRQSKPFATPKGMTILQQSTDRPAVVLTLLRRAAEAGSSSLTEIKGEKAVV